jgi:hypothetical protein
VTGKQVAKEAAIACKQTRERARARILRLALPHAADSSPEGFSPMTDPAHKPRLTLMAPLPSVWVNAQLRAPPRGAGVRDCAHGRPRVVENRVEWRRDARWRSSPSTLARRRTRTALASAPALLSPLRCPARRQSRQPLRRRRAALPLRQAAAMRADDRAQPRRRGRNRRAGGPQPHRWQRARPERPPRGPTRP